MLSYKHAFHAGNHADAVKHLCLLGLLHCYQSKNKPFCVFDTHAGAGLYDLNASEVLKNKEFESGTGRLTDPEQNDKLLSQYTRLVKQYGEIEQIPGSPMIALETLEHSNPWVGFEKHPSEFEKLKLTVQHANGHVHHRDGFEGLLALSPPAQKRGIVLIDPPYESLNEYNAVVAAVRRLKQKWQNACVAIWYPLLGQRAKTKSGLSEQMCTQLSELEPTGGVLDVRLQVSDQEDDIGMYGSGLIILNPPWQFESLFSGSLHQLGELLGAIRTSSEWLVRPD